MDFLNSLTQKFPDHSDLINQIRNYFNNKYWHQFGEAVLKFACFPEVGKTDSVQQIFQMIYDNFQINLDPVIFVRLAELACLKIEGCVARVEFLDKVKERVKREKHANIMVSSLLALVYIIDNNFEKANEILIETEVQLKSMYNLEKIVYSFFFKSKSVYYLKKSDFSEFYTNSLQYLAYTEIEEFSDQERKTICINMAVAILISPKIFNFSELLKLEVFNSLKGTEDEWLYQLMETYNQGNVEQFYRDIEQHKAKIEANQVLKNNARVLEDKIKITAFTELVFSLPKNERELSFSKISEVTRIPEEGIEHMILKAMSLDLLKGSIDQVSRTVYFTWIQPRVLDKERVLKMKSKFSVWKNTVEGLLGFTADYQNSLN